MSITKDAPSTGEANYICFKQKKANKYASCYLCGYQQMCNHKSTNFTPEEYLGRDETGSYPKMKGN